MKIIIDTREQCPFDFSSHDGAEVTAGTLAAGDYSLQGMESLVAVERKELSDLLNCLGADRERFFRELDRLRGYEAAALVIEAPLAVIAAGRYRSRISPQSAVQSLIAIQAQYRIPVFFATGRSQAADYTFDFLRHYQNAIERRYRACFCKSQ